MIFSERADGRLAELESWRGFAALYVLLSHTLVGVLAPSGYAWTAPFRLGQEAVMLFFVISGFAVHYATRRRPVFNLRRFAGSRALRVYPVLAVALLLAWACNSLAAHRPLSPDLRVLCGNLLMQQDAYTALPGYMGDGPLWSLSYEAAYYGLYALVLTVCPTQWRAAAFLTASAAAASTLLWTPSHWGRVGLYGCVWWLGVELCEVHLGGTRRRLAAPLALIVLCIVCLAVAWRVRGLLPNSGGATGIGAFPVREMRNLAAGLGAALVWLGWSRLGWRGFILRPMDGIAPLSYALYVIHTPLMVTLKHAFPGVGPWAWFLSAGAATLALAYVLDGVFQAWVTALFARPPRGSVRSVPSPGAAEMR